MSASPYALDPYTVCDLFFFMQSCHDASHHEPMQLSSQELASCCLKWQPPQLWPKWLYPVLDVLFQTCKRNHYSHHMFTKYLSCLNGFFRHWLTLRKVYYFIMSADELTLHLTTKSHQMEVLHTLKVLTFEMHFWTDGYILKIRSSLKFTSSCFVQIFLWVYLCEFVCYKVKLYWN